MNLYLEVMEMIREVNKVNRRSWRLCRETKGMMEIRQRNSNNNQLRISLRFNDNN